MNKEEFMKKLNIQLKHVNDEERKDILADYEEHFVEGKKKKRSEAEIAKALGDPKDIAKQLKAEHLVKKAEGKTNWTNTWRAVFATMSLGFLNLIIVLGPFIALVAVIISLFAVGVSIVATGLAMFFGSIVGFIMPVHPLPSVALAGTLVGGIGVGALGILMIIGMWYLTKLFFKGVVWYLKFNMKIIGGKNED